MSDDIKKAFLAGYREGVTAHNTVGDESLGHGEFHYKLFERESDFVDWKTKVNEMLKALDVYWLIDAGEKTCPLCGDVDHDYCHPNAWDHFEKLRAEVESMCKPTPEDSSDIQKEKKQ